MEFNFDDVTDVTDVTLALQAASRVTTLSHLSQPPAETRAKQAASNRERMPEIAAFVDHLRGLFGPVTVRFASENGFEFGERGPEGVPISPPQLTTDDLKKGAR